MIGPVGIDLAHCRIGFVCMYGLTGADHFLEAYRSIGHDDSRDDQLQARCDAVQCWFDAFLYQPWFDLGMQLTEKGIRDRLDAYAVNIASRLD